MKKFVSDIKVSYNLIYCNCLFLILMSFEGKENIGAV